MVDIAEVILVDGFIRIPKVQQLIKEFFDDKVPSYGINPDEAVTRIIDLFNKIKMNLRFFVPLTCGTAILANILSGNQHSGDIVSFDTNLLILGIKIIDGIMSQ